MTHRCLASAVRTGQCLSGDWQLFVETNRAPTPAAVRYGEYRRMTKVDEWRASSRSHEPVLEGLGTWLLPKSRFAFLFKDILSAEYVNDGS